MSATGALVLAFFATVWWVVGLRAAGHGAAWVFAMPIVAAVALAALYGIGTRRTGAGNHADLGAEKARRGLLIGRASGIEGLAIFIAAIVLGKVGHPNALVPTIALIVGAHFVPLARGLPAPAYYATAVVLAALGVVGLAIPDLATRLTLVSAGSAIVLWLTAGSALRRAERLSGREGATGAE